MKLIDCYIENFGKLSDFKHSFSDGLNSIKKDNGYGKTTLTVFIKAMLFGLDDTKRAKIENNDRKHYLPWNNGRCGGSITFETSGKRYRIERTFMPKATDDTFKLYDVKSGKESTDFSKNLGEELFSIDADGFERTVFLSEANLSGKNENKTVSAKLSDLVGTDGDLSAMDEAIELLEKQRKIYHKRGNTGEIWEVKRQIGEADREINDLIRMKSLYKEEEEKLKEVTIELSKLYEKKNELIKEAKLADQIRVKKSFEKQYKSMKKSIEEEEEIKRTLENFFKNGLPTSEEIEKMKELSIEARRLVSTEHDNDSREFLYLADFFSSNVPDKEFLKMKEHAAKTDELKREKQLLEREFTVRQSETTTSLPSAEQTDALIKELLSSKKRNENKPLHYALPVGIVITLLGILLGILVSPVLLLVCALGILVSAFGLKTVFGEKSSSLNTNAREFLKKYGDFDQADDDSIIEKLYEIKNAVQNTEKQIKDAEILSEKITTLSEEINNREREACEFISLFPKTDCNTVGEAIAEILRKWDIFTAIREARAVSNKKREENSVIANRYESQVSAFLSRFPTLSSRPFEEISAKLIEYNAQKLSLERMNSALSAFAVEHGINPDEISDEIDPEFTVTPEDENLDARISELEKTKALTERSCRNLLAETERIDDLEARKEELSEREQDYEKRLDIILKTQKYLGEAKDNLTSKYLSKTKSAFNKYISLISRETGEVFSMDTSFSIMKNEGGTLRQTEAYSRGTRDLYALATRFALIDSLYTDETPFVILDDPFAYFDDAKFSRAAVVIQQLAKQKQIIYMTCSDARKI